MLHRCSTAIATCAFAVAAIAAAGEEDAEREWQYQVVEGDTLIGITESYLEPTVRWQRLQRLNRITEPRRLQTGSVVRAPMAWVRREAVVAEAVHVRGDVDVARAGGVTERVVVGMQLHAGDELHAGAESSATLRFVDGSRLLLMPATRLRVDRLLLLGNVRAADTRLHLHEGGADAQVAPTPARRFEIRTPVVNLGVRGTDFRASVDAGAARLRLEVLDGAVAAGAGAREVAVGAGFGTVVGGTGEVSAPRRLLAAPDLRGVAPRLERVPLRLEWQPLPGAARYHAQVFPDNQAGRLLLDGYFDSAAARWSDLPDGRYVLRVRGVDTDGLEGMDGQWTFVLKARPEPPFTREPAPDARVYGDGATLRWSQSASAARYRLQVSRGADFEQSVADLRDLGATEHRLQLPPGEYRWRVASVTADGDQGPFGDAQTFTQRPIPTSPTIEPPQQSAGGLLLRWRSEGADVQYEYQMARDDGFTEIVAEGRTREPQFVLAAPVPGPYYLHVKTIDADGFAGPYGESQRVEVPYPKWLLLLPAAVLLLLAL